MKIINKMCVLDICKVLKQFKKYNLYICSITSLFHSGCFKFSWLKGGVVTSFFFIHKARHQTHPNQLIKHLQQYNHLEI